MQRNNQIETGLVEMGVDTQKYLLQFFRADDLLSMRQTCKGFYNIVHVTENGKLLQQAIDSMPAPLRAYFANEHQNITDFIDTVMIPLDPISMGDRGFCLGRELSDYLNSVPEDDGTDNDLMVLNSNRDPLLVLRDFALASTLGIAGFALVPSLGAVAAYSIYASTYSYAVGGVGAAGITVIIPQVKNLITNGLFNNKTIVEQKHYAEVRKIRKMINDNVEHAVRDSHTSSFRIKF